MEERAVLHIDADTFFLAVHEREDSTLIGAPVALWQYNDVICASESARRLGVKKHMTPKQAADLIMPAGGRLLHCFWRDWPGPRVFYGPYNAASRELFRAISDTLVHVMGPGVASSCIIERSSVDEAFIDCTAAAMAELPLHSPPGGLVLAAERIAQRLAQRLQNASLRLPLSIGVAHNKLLAKLASGRAKALRATDEAGGVWCVRGSYELELLLSNTPAKKLPGLGSRESSLARAGATSVADLRAALPTSDAIARELQLGADVASGVWQRCRGIDETPVRTIIPQSVSATSWLAGGNLSDVARTSARGSSADGPPITIGVHVFEAHPKHGARKSNDSRERWILLALAMDLEDRAFHHAILHNQSPSKLTVAWQYRPWSSAEHAAGGSPSAEGRSGSTHSRTTRLPAHMYADVAEDDLSLTSRRRESTRFRSSGRTDDMDADADVGATGTLFVDATDEQQELLDSKTAYGKRVAAIVEAAAKLLAAWAAERPMQRLSQLTLTASGFAAHPSAQGGLRAFLTVQQSPRPLQQQPPPVPHDDTPSGVRPTSARGGDAEDDSWSCRRCTLINASSVSRCDACDDPKPNRFKHAKRNEGNCKAIGTVKGAPSTSAAGSAGAIDRFVVRGKQHRP